MAFCEWASEALGREIRLPTEFEWQLAATGDEPGRTYPWGGDWDPKAEPWRANTYESGLGGTTAVGLYPHGASPVGAQDMAGTLWEWCLNAFEDPDDVGFPRAADDRRVVRGGSWVGDQPDARAAFRDLGVTRFRSGYCGFRLVCSSPISER
jgi:formylglycine-generating enzyme required for sulfatase activity